MAVQPVKHRKHLFTSKKKSFRASLSDCLGGVALVFTIVTLYLTYRRNGEATLEYGAAFLMCVVIALVGMIFAILSRREPDTYYFFSYLGMVLNGIVLALGIAAVIFGTA